MPVGRLASNWVSPLGGAPTIEVLATPMVGGPCAGPCASLGPDELVPVTVVYMTHTVSATSAGSA